MREIIFAIQQIGPYHHARFQALSDDFNVVVIETRPQDTTYSWETDFPDAKYKSIPLSRNPLRLAKVIGRKPIFICGWYDKEMLLLLGISWLKKSKRIIISDSRAADAVRVFWKEKLKQFILKFYHAGLVAGKESEAYLRQLKFLKPVGKPWDVVDVTLWKPTTGITKENYWVFPARLVEKKNHVFFLSAFAQAIEKVENPPKLFLCGDGPLQLEIERLIEELGIEHLVVFKGFVHTKEMVEIMQKAQWMVLPSIYDQWGLVVNEALASGTRVLLSDNCGAKELIEVGVNGYLLNDNNALIDLMPKIDALQKEESAKNMLPQGFTMHDFVDAVKKIADVG